jgi:hypothetical protein
LASFQGHSHRWSDGDPCVTMPLQAVAANDRPGWS